MAPLTPCGDSWNTTKWCCGRNNTDCCANWDSKPEGAVELALDFYNTSTSSTLQPANELSPAAKGGIAVGSVILALFFITVGWLVGWRLTKRRFEKEKAEAEHCPNLSYSWAHSKEMHELYQNPLKHELDGRPLPHEMPEIHNFRDKDVYVQRAAPSTWQQSPTSIQSTPIDFLKARPF